MKIHFCDLCNESVPQSDLDEGRAFLREGRSGRGRRVICAVCDRSMSHEPASAGGPFDPVGSASAGGALGAATAARSPADGAAPARPAPASGSGVPVPAGAASAAAPATPVVVQRGRSGGGGSGLALMALLFTGGLGFWASGKITKLESDLENRTQRLEDGQFDARMTLDQQLETQAETVSSLDSGLRAELREMRDWLNAELAEGQLQSRQVSDRLAEFGARLESMGEAFGNVNRHDQELVMLQQRYTSLSEELTALLDGAGAGGIAKAIGGAGSPAGAGEGAAEPAASEPAVEEPEAPPPWMGLVDQLSSPNTSARWQAVVALGDTNDPAVSEFLLEALVDEDIFIRMVTARVLGDLGSPTGIPALIEALDDPESAVREAAYIALKAVTKRDFSFDPVDEDASDRARQIRAWRDWWERERDNYAEG